MKINFLRFQSLCLGMSLTLLLQGIGAETSSFLKEKQWLISSKPLYEIGTLGAPTTGALVEGMVGSMNKGCRYRFHCHSADPQEGFLGPQAIAKPLNMKNQPGVFPAPFMRPASLTFHFNCEYSNTLLTPLVVRPDGTILQGLPLTTQNTLQSIVIPSPAQTGVYTLFILAHEKEIKGTEVRVEATIDEQPQQSQLLHLRSFEQESENPALISAEFIYTQDSSN